MKYPKHGDIPFYQRQHRMVLENCGTIDAEDIDEYLAKDGYVAFEKALFEMTDEAICKEILDSGLRGRGGGGFPAGRKWDSVRKQPEGKKYVVCNGDEGDPGAFMDRSIMEGNPHSIIEGMLIAALGVGSGEGYIYVRAEYPLAVNRLKTAIAKAEEMHLLGDHILGTDFSFHLHVNRGAGAFVCGEGSALTASIEGGADGVCLCIVSHQIKLVKILTVCHQRSSAGTVILRADQRTLPLAVSGGGDIGHACAYDRAVNLIPRLDARRDGGLLRVDGLVVVQKGGGGDGGIGEIPLVQAQLRQGAEHAVGENSPQDRKSTRLNSSHWS